jgi:hypothetical protein
VLAAVVDSKFVNCVVWPVVISQANKFDPLVYTILESLKANWGLLSCPFVYVIFLPPDFISYKNITIVHNVGSPVYVKLNTICPIRLFLKE